MKRSKKKTKTPCRKLAERIARDLFTNGNRQRADRLLLVREPGGARGSYQVDLGGWCEPAMADRIERALRRVTITLYAAGGGK